MSPTIVVRDGRPVLILGGAGGPVIITAVLQTIIDVLDFGDQLAEEIPAHRPYRYPVVDVARGKLNSQELARVIDHNVKFEAVKPAHGAFSSPR